MRLSLVLITLNAASSLSRCLESVEGLADEILLVDSGSTDGTLEIARVAGARTLHRDFDGYGSQKQFALEQARGEWLLCLDADEWLDPIAWDGIRHLLAHGDDPSPDGFWLRRVTLYLGRWVNYGPWLGERKLRLVRRNRARWDADCIHESLRLIRGRAGHLDGCILHRPYDSLSHQLAKLDRYTDLIAARDADTPLLRVLFGVSLEPWLVFLHRYLVQLGFLDGSKGLIGCGMSGFYFFLRYAKILLRRQVPADSP
ncbi:glycosyltransferase [Thiocystis minor]|uniref:glycosyltransferase n=1 Tax=Thiocystis minor TaxID=61597 RepID=UPI001914A0F4